MSSPPSRSLCCQRRPADKDGDDLQGQLDAIDHTIDEMNDAANALARARMGGQGRQRRARLSASLRLDRLKMEVLREKREQDKKRWRGLEIPLDRSAGRALLSRVFATPGLKIKDGTLRGWDTIDEMNAAVNVAKVDTGDLGASGLAVLSLAMPCWCPWAARGESAPCNKMRGKSPTGYRARPPRPLGVAPPTTNKHGPCACVFGACPACLGSFPR